MLHSLARIAIHAVFSTKVPPFQGSMPGGNLSPGLRHWAALLPPFGLASFSGMSFDRSQELQNLYLSGVEQQFCISPSPWVV